MTGTEIRVNVSRTSPDVATQATERPHLASTSRAIETRSSRVSSRQRLIVPAASSASVTAGRVTVMVTSSRSTVTSWSAQPSGSRPLRKPVRPSVLGAAASCP